MIIAATIMHVVCSLLMDRKVFKLLLASNSQVKICHSLLLLEVCTFSCYSIERCQYVTLFQAQSALLWSARWMADILGHCRVFYRYDAVWV